MFDEPMGRSGCGSRRHRATPLAFHEVGGSRRTVEVAYTLDADRHQYGFRLGAYDRSHPLVIDPLLQSTLVGGNGSEAVLAITIAPDTGDVYVAGETFSNNFPGAAGA